MTELQVNALIEEVYKKKYNKPIEERGTHLPIRTVRNLRLEPVAFNAYLDIAATNDYNKLIDAIMDYDLSCEEVLNFLQTYPKHISHLPLKFINRNYNDLIGFIILNKELFTREMLPLAIKNEKQIIELYKPKGEEKKQSTDNLDKFVNDYLNSKMSLTNFCLKNGIDNIKGFRRIVDSKKDELFGKKESKDMESEFPIKKTGGVRNNHKKRAQLLGEKKLREIAKKIANGEITLEDYLKDYYHPYYTIFALVSTLNDEEKKKFNITMANQLRKYILIDHPQDLETDKIEDLFDYVLSYINVDTISKCGLGSEVKRYISQYSTEYNDSEAQTIISKVNASILPWQSLYNKGSVQYCIDDKRDIYTPPFEITKELIDAVVKYLVDNDIYVNYKTANLYLKKALLGEITLTKDEEKEKEKTKGM